MHSVGILVRFTRVKDYLPVVLLVIPLIFLISPVNLFTSKTLIIFFSNLFLTAFCFTFNDVEDAEDDFFDIEKRGRNPIASGELSTWQGYSISFLFLSVGLILLVFINYFIFLLGVVMSFMGFFYSWKPLRLKSIPFVDVISHVIFLGVIQFLITYLSFRSLDLSVIPFLMIIIPFSVLIELFGELKDFEVDKKTNINNSIQNLSKFKSKLFILSLLGTIVTGFLLVLYTIPPEFRAINFSVILFVGIIGMFRIGRRAKQYI